jgi:Protein of unknown function (DUF3309)
VICSAARPGPVRKGVKVGGPAGSGACVSRQVNSQRRETMLGTILVVFLILALLGALPRWSHSRDWGYMPTGGVGLALFIVVILVLLGRI